MLLFLNAHTAFGELLRLPVLVEHYTEHRQINQESFLDFLIQHYARQIRHSHGNSQDHEKLPFKSVNTNAQAPVLLPEPAPSLTPVWVQPTPALKTMPHRQHYASAYQNSIWQPPRF